LGTALFSESSRKGGKSAKSKIEHHMQKLAVLKNINRVQATAFILGTSMMTIRLEYKYVDLTPGLNFVFKRTHSMPSGFKEYLKCSKTPKADNHTDNSMII
jgi:hypothetical protein